MFNIVYASMGSLQLLNKIEYNEIDNLRAIREDYENITYMESTTKSTSADLERY